VTLRWRRPSGLPGGSLPVCDGPVGHARSRASFLTCLVSRRAVPFGGRGVSGRGRHCVDPGSDPLPLPLPFPLPGVPRPWPTEKTCRDALSLRSTRHRPDAQPHAAEPRDPRSPQDRTQPAWLAASFPARREREGAGERARAGTRARAMLPGKATGSLRGEFRARTILPLRTFTPFPPATRGKSRQISPGLPP